MSRSVDIDATMRDVSGQVAVGIGNVQVGSVHGGVVNISTQGTVTERARPIALRPRPPVALFGRADVVDELLTAIADRDPATLVGEPGMGKTTLLRHLAQVDGGAGEDGLAYVSARGHPLDDVLQCLFDLFYESDPPFHPSDARLRSDLANRRATFLIDDVDLAPDEITSLTDVAPGCAFVLVSSDPSAWLPTRVVPLAGLSLDDALSLTGRVLRRSLDADDVAAVSRIATLVDGSPAKIEQAVALARTPGRTLTWVADELARRRPAPPALSADESRVLELLAAAVPDVVPLEVIASVTGIDDAASVMSGLEARALVESHSPRYSLVGAAGSYPDEVLDGWRERVMEHLAAWSSERRADDEDVGASVDLGLRLLRWAGGSAAAVALGRAIEPALVVSRRWGSWHELLDHVGAAAKATGDVGAEAWTLHEAGTRALLLEDYGTARTLLGRARSLREAIGDTAGAAVTLHNLGQIPFVPPPNDSDDRGSRGPRRGPAGLVALGAVLLALAGDVPDIEPSVIVSSLVPAPATVTFAPTQVDAVTTETIVVRNGGSSPAQLGAPVLGGPHAGEFSVVRDSCSEGALVAGSTCEIEVSFAPRELGARTASVRLGVTGGDPVVVAVLGTAEEPPPVVTVAPSTVDFGSVTVGSSASAVLSLRNDGRFPVRPAAASTSPAGAYAVTADGCQGQTLQAGQGCEIEVTFRPVAPGPSEATLSVPVGPSTAAVSLTGSGAAPVVIPPPPPPPPPSPQPLVLVVRKRIEPPSSLCATLGTTSLALSWPAVEGAVSYVVTRAGGGSIRATETSFTDEGLLPATAYAYTLQSIDGDGELSAPTRPVTFTTRVLEPPAPEPEVQ